MANFSSCIDQFQSIISSWLPTLICMFVLSPKQLSKNIVHSSLVVEKMHGVLVHVLDILGACYTTWKQFSSQVYVLYHYGRYGDIGVGVDGGLETELQGEGEGGVSALMAYSMDKSQLKRKAKGK